MDKDGIILMAGGAALVGGLLLSLKSSSSPGASVVSYGGTPGNSSQDTAARLQLGGQLFQGLTSVYQSQQDRAGQIAMANIAATTHYNEFALQQSTDLQKATITAQSQVDAAKASKPDFFTSLVSTFGKLFTIKL